MQLSGPDETDLLLPLAEAEPAFERVLARLLRRAGAAQAALLQRPAGALASHLLATAGEPQPPDALLGLPLDHLRPGRVYASAEFIDAAPPFAAGRLAALQARGLADERILRLPDIKGSPHWLLLASRRPLPAGTAALMSALGPHLALALARHAGQQQQRLFGRAAETALAATGTCWLLFDRRARLLAHGPAAPGQFRAAGLPPPAAGERLSGLDPVQERLLHQAAEHIAADASAPPAAVRLAADPWFDMQLRPAPAPAPAAGAMLGICRLGAPPPPQAPRLLASLTQLPPRQAELAARLAGGHSIAAAARAMGLTLETARNYSRQVYAALGVGGQVELMRRLGPSAALMGEGNR